MIKENDDRLPGMAGGGITTAVRFTGSDVAELNDKTFDMQKIDTSDYLAKRRLLNANMLRRNLQRKDPVLCKEVTEMSKHMEVK